MKMACRIVVALWVVCAAGQGWAANSISIESQDVALGAAGVQVGVFIENDVNATAIVMPLEVRSLTAGTYVTTTFSFAANAAGRANASPLSATGNNPGNPGGWPPASVTSKKFAAVSLPQCSGPVSNSYLTGVGQIDFVSPDAIFYATVSTGDPGIGEDIAMDPGVDPPGVPSFRFTFDVTSVDGFFEIDSCCIKPANHVSFVDDNTTLVQVVFTKSLIKVGSPSFPPVVSDIPDQVINEGQSFATIALDNYVNDPDDLDANITWTATGQTQLTVTIGAGRIATIHTPDADYFGSETITFTATDPLNHTASDQATFTVNPVNDPPVLATITNKIRQAGLNLNFAVNGSDIDNTLLTLSMLNAPGGATLSQDGAGNGTFDWQTVCADSGIYDLTFIVSDGSLADSQMVQITIQPNPDRFGTDADTLFFQFVLGDSVPETQTLQVTDPGCADMDFTAVADSLWVQVVPGSGHTPQSLTIDIDTTGMTGGLHNSALTLTQVGALGTPATKKVHLIVRADTVICRCLCQGDPPPFCDGEINIQSVILVINVAFRGAAPVGLATCPALPHDVNCDCSIDVLDVIHEVNTAFRSGPGPCDPCRQLQSTCEGVIP